MSHALVYAGEALALRREMKKKKKETKKLKIKLLCESQQLKYVRQNRKNREYLLESWNEISQTVPGLCDSQSVLVFCQLFSRSVSTMKLQRFNLFILRKTYSGLSHSIGSFPEM